MSAEAVELVLYELGVKREARAGFAADPSAFLARYAVTEAESAMVTEFDVAAMQGCGVSPLLTMGFWMMNHPRRSRQEYLDQLQRG